jgi:predicted RNase H-like HicB family nuclease
LSDYVAEALARATFEKREDGNYAGRIPCCAGVVAFETSLRECENELRSTLEDWILVGLQLKHPLPVIERIDLNKELAREPVDAASAQRFHPQTPSPKRQGWPYRIGCWAKPFTLRGAEDESPEAQPELPVLM